MGLPLASMEGRIRLAHRGGDTTMAFKVLVVSKADVCGSPTAVVLMGRLLNGALLGDDCELRSAGIDVEADSPSCLEAACWLGFDTQDQRQFVQRAPCALRKEVVRAADLVLVMGRAHRTWVIEAMPTASSYTFTLTQAAVFGAAVRQSLPGWSARRRHDQLDLAPLPVDGTASDRARWFVSEMNAARGQVRLAEVSVPMNRRWGRGHASPDQTYDIPDPHGRESVSHARALGLVRDAVDSWTNALVSVVSQEHAIR